MSRAVLLYTGEGLDDDDDDDYEEEVSRLDSGRGSGQCTDHTEWAIEKLHVIK